jgi:pimeloyl-ACP methyl ester carboxylesterase
VRFSWLALLLLIVCASGCAGFAARRMVQAPNTYPQWLAPKAPVTLEFSNKMLAVFTNQYLQISNPEARIRYRIMEPADYQFHWSNYVDQAHGQFDLSFSAQTDHLQDRTNQWTQNPRGTVVLLHGYGVASFAMLPWGFLLAEEGWRCVLVDLRGHGKSTGKQIYFGTQEVRDLTALLDQLNETQPAALLPVSVIGDSYGAVLALRWKMIDPRVGKVVAISPYADLSSAILNISEQYAPWLPKSFIKAGVRKLPDLLHVKPTDLNPSSWMSAMKEEQRRALFIAGGKDKIAPLDQVERLYQLAGPGNELVVVPDAAHEPLPFYLDQLAPPITHWLAGEHSAGASASYQQQRPLDNHNSAKAAFSKQALN